MKKRTLRSNQETDEGKRCAALANSLTKKAPYKGLGAESEEKHEPVSDIDTVVVNSLKALDPEWPIREAGHLLITPFLNSCGQLEGSRLERPSIPQQLVDRDR
jgi:hypothetical protein